MQNNKDLTFQHYPAFLNLTYSRQVLDILKFLFDKEHFNYGNISSMWKLRSSRPEVYCKWGVLKNLAKFIGKHLCQGLLFNKVTGLRPATLLKKRLWHRCFLVNFAKFLRKPFYIEHLWWLLLEVANVNSMNRIFKIHQHSSSLLSNKILLMFELKVVISQFLLYLIVYF